jgi:hypothetical protein
MAQTAAQKAAAAAKAKADALKATQQAQTIRAKIDASIIKKVDLEQQEALLRVQAAQAGVNSAAGKAYLKQINDTLLAAEQKLAAAIVSDNQKLLQITSAKKPLTKAQLAKVDKDYAKTKNFYITVFDGTLTNFNVPAAADAYFSSRERFLLELNAANIKDPAVYNNAVNKPSVVYNAANLWRTAGAHKGMIQTWTPPDGSTPATPTVGGAKVNVDNTRYGYQFLYNPGTVEMTWQGVPNTDVGLQTSGNEKFNLYGTSVTQSTIKIQLVLNRMFDMKYYNANPGQDTGLLTNSSVSLKPNVDIKKVYPGRQPSPQEQADIVNKGTMYDIEYLLRTLLGFTAYSSLRGEKTADIGYVSAKPVELHLGNKLRYLVFIGGIGVNHIMFTENMVPIFSTLSLTCNRIPDYGATKNIPVKAGGWGSHVSGG